MKVIHQCKHCGKEFLSYKCLNRKYCSKDCFYKDRTGRKEIVGWSREYKCCVDCGRTDRPYHAYGRCNYCYNRYPKIQMMKKKLNLSSLKMIFHMK